MARSRNNKSTPTNDRRDGNVSNGRDKARGGKEARGSKTGRSRGGRNDSYRDTSTSNASLMHQAMGATNDPEWYTRNPSLTIASASIPFPNRPGMGINPLETELLAKYELPGVAVLNWAPTVGKAAEPTDPINVAGKELFAQVRSVFSGSIEADAPDFIVYLMALDSIYAYISGLKRIYSIVSQYSSDNYYVPEKLLQALGFTTAHIKQLQVGKMQLFNCVQTLIGMVQKFQCPAVFPVFARHYWLNANIYTDEASFNSQWFMFNMSLCYKYSTLETPDKVPAGGLTPTLAFENYPNNTDIVVELFDRGKAMIDALAASDDAYIISGYLRRAYDGAPQFTVEPLSMDATYAPVYDPVVLMQIENSFVPVGIKPGIIKPSTLSATLNVSQNPKTNCVLCSMDYTPFNVTETFARCKPKILLSLRSDAPGAVDVVEASRLINTPSEDGSYVIAGTELLFGWTYNNRDLDQFQVLNVSDIKTNGTAVNGIISDIAHMSAFDWQPRIEIVTFLNAEATAATNVRLVWDIHNMTSISTGQMHDINRVCLYSLFNAFNVG